MRLSTCDIRRVASVGIPIVERRTSETGVSEGVGGGRGQRKHGGREGGNLLKLYLKNIGLIRIIFLRGTKGGRKACWL